MKKLFFTTRPASALLIAILVMGILVTLTLGLSDLVIREIRQTSDLVSSGQAYFAAEAGIENALYDLHSHFPGYEPNPKIQNSAQPDVLDYSYTIDNKGNKLPYFDPQKPVFLSPDKPATNADFLYKDKPEATYNTLPLNGSVVIPLCADDGTGKCVDITNFLIEYYVCFGGDADKCTDQTGWLVSDIQKMDILRWKIFGRPKLASPDPLQPASQTDAISDFYPTASIAKAEQPVCMGTDPGIHDKIFPGILPCITPVTEGGVFSGARECYSSDAGSFLGADGLIVKDPSKCSIVNFINSHTQNYLVLTNVVNADVIAATPGTDQGRLRTNIYYRIVAAPDQALAHDQASISSDGYAADKQTKQSIDVQIGLDTFLPVFNFSLYHTKTGLLLTPVPGGKFTPLMPGI